jgi:toluene monooxygenase system ferredoxin subunit
MSFRRVCSKDDLWEGEMAEFEVEGQNVLLIHLSGGELRALPPGCPHQNQPLIEGTLEGSVLTCSAHSWQFDVASGKGINPAHCKLVLLSLKVEGDDVYVDVG